MRRLILIGLLLGTVACASNEGGYSFDEAYEHNKEYWQCINESDGSDSDICKCVHAYTDEPHDLCDGEGVRWLD